MLKKLSLLRIYLIAHITWTEKETSDILLVGPFTGDMARFSEIARYYRMLEMIVECWVRF